MSFVMADFYKRFVDEELDSEGRLKSFKLDLPENFNFSYDVIDELAKNVPIRWLCSGSTRRVRSISSLTRIFLKRAVRWLT